MKLFFTAHRLKGYCAQYAHARISIYIQPGEYQSGRNPILELQWQSDSESRAHWYGFHAEARSDSGTGLNPCEQWRKAATLLGKLKCESPMQTVEELVALGIERKVFDCRLGKYLAPSEVLPAEFKRWMARLDGQCIASTVADSEESAITGLLKCLGDRIAHPKWTSAESSASNLQGWLQNGRQIEMDFHSPAPEMDSLEEMWKPLGVEQVAEAV